MIYGSTNFEPYKGLGYTEYGKSNTCFRFKKSGPYWFSTQGTPGLMVGQTIHRQ